MTDRKSLSDEDLTEYASQADNGELSIRQQHELIAQAREENRLREATNDFLARLIGCCGGAELQTYAYGFARRLGVDLDMSVATGELRVDPTARAKRELGEWLAAAPKRYFSEFAPEVMAPIGAPRRYNWTIKLTEHGTDMGIGDDPDRTKALMAALLAAKEAGR